MITQTYVYDDPEHPDRPTSTIFSPAYTAEDHALLMGLDQYETDLCKCGVPRSIAWHPEMDGYFEVDEYVCHACTAQAPEPAAGKTRDEVKYVVPRSTRPDSKGPLLPFLAN